MELRNERARAYRRAVRHRRLEQRWDRLDRLEWVLAAVTAAAIVAGLAIVCGVV